MDVLNAEIIKETTKEIADNPEMVQRLLWWLRHGQSCERWFQFEWAYRLESVLGKRFPSTYLVGCERDWVDIVVYQQTSKPELALNQQKVYAGIELKWCGNWSASNSIAETEKDLRKTRENVKYSYPVLALSIWLFATPSQNNDPSYSWIAKQIKKEKINWETLDPKLYSLKPDFRTDPFKIDCPKDFGKLEIFCVGFYNEKARSSS